MRKKILIIISIILTIVVVLQANNTRTSISGKIFDDVEKNYSDLMKAVDSLLQYEPGDVFYLGDDRFYLSADNDTDINNELLKGQLYVENNTDRNSDDGVPIAINDKYIQKSLELNGAISEISRGKNVIDFVGDDLVCDQPNKFCGFYYSRYGEPQITRFFEGESLKKDGEGWVYIPDKKHNRYYTEKIKDYMYYYEGEYQ